MTQAAEVFTRDLIIGERPLLVVDVDEVVLQFVAPFKAFLKANGHELKLDTFSLNGNVISLDDGRRVDVSEVGALLSAFYDNQENWQAPFDTARDTLEGLTDIADVLLLTAMPRTTAKSGSGFWSVTASIFR
nr:hypothetical protein [Marinicella sp. W31]MDC2876515.1 hypothetical protein [Marinicella sp. W31]